MMQTRRYMCNKKMFVFTSCFLHAGVGIVKLKMLQKDSRRLKNNSVVK